MSSETGWDPKLYDRFPTPEDRPEGELEQLEETWCGPRSGWEWLTAINNNFIEYFEFPIKNKINVIIIR